MANLILPYFTFSADGNYEVRYKSNVLIYPDGEVLWVPPAIYQVLLVIVHQALYIRKSRELIYYIRRGAQANLMGP